MKNQITNRQYTKYCNRVDRWIGDCLGCIWDVLIYKEHKTQKSSCFVCSGRAEREARGKNERRPSLPRVTLGARRHICRRQSEMDSRCSVSRVEPLWGQPRRCRTPLVDRCALDWLFGVYAVCGLHCLGSTLFGVYAVWGHGLKN